MILGPFCILKDAQNHFIENKRMSGAMKVAGGGGSRSSLVKIQAKMVSVIAVLLTPHLSLPLSLELLLVPKSVIRDTVFIQPGILKVQVIPVPS